MMTYPLTSFISTNWPRHSCSPMKKIPLKASSQRAIVEALAYFIEKNIDNPEMTQFTLRPFRIAQSEMKRAMEDKKKNK